MPALESNPLATKWSHRKLYTLMMLLYHQHDITSPDPCVNGEMASDIIFRSKMKRQFMDRTQCNEAGLSWLLLGAKMRGFGQGRWNGYGGKVETGDDSPKAAAIREMQEESGLVIDPSSIEEFGRFWFTFEGDAKCLEVHAYINWNWKPNVADDGTLEWPRSTEEMQSNWFPLATRKTGDGSDAVSTSKLFGHKILDAIALDTCLLPFDCMWPDDRVWLTNALHGKHVIGWLHCCPTEMSDAAQDHVLADQNKENMGLSIDQYCIPGYRFEFYSPQRLTEDALGKTSSFSRAIDQMGLNSEDRLRQWMSSRDETPVAGAAVTAPGTTAQVALFG